MPDDLKINEWLLERYGTTADLKPIFRVVWTTNLTEKRFGNFSDYTEGGIYLRSYKGIKEVLKYPYDQERWVLEQLVELNQDSEVAKELVQNKWSYEPLYIFKDKDGKFLPLNRDMIEILLYFWLNRHKHKRTPTEITEEYLQREEADKERIRQKIGENQQLWHKMDLVW